MKKLKINMLFLFSMLTFFSCDKQEEESMTPSLYDRLGGVNAISAVVDEFIGRVAVNPDMVRTFKPLLEDVAKNGANSARLASLRNSLIDQIGEASGGPQKYKGKDMVTAHKGMMITEVEFNSLAGDLSGALDKFKVPPTEKNELMTVIGSLKGQIVGQ